MKKRYVFFIVFIVLILFTVLKKVDSDLVWTYGFSYNISKGMIPYKDYNMIIGPLYSLIFSFPISLFGNYLIVFEIFHVLLFSIILTMSYKKLNNKVFWLVFTLFIQNTICGYNTFISVLMILIFLLIDSNNKYKNLLIGLIIGLIIITKQNIGIPVFLVYLYKSNNKIKSILYTMIPIIITIIYLIINQALFEYIDICYLGMGNFIKNLYIDISTLTLYVLTIIYLIKEYINNHDQKILYIIAYSLVIFPLVEAQHFLFIIPILAYYILLNNTNKIINISFKLFIIIGVITNLITMNTNRIIITGNNPFKYNSFNKGFEKYLDNYSKYLKKIDGEIYLFVGTAYPIKIYNNEPLTFYDLINKGNLGKNEKKYLDKITKTCKNKKCTFILDKKYFKNKIERSDQMNVIFKNYVLKNYNYIETLPSKDRVYTN